MEEGDIKKPESVLVIYSFSEKPFSLPPNKDDMIQFSPITASFFNQRKKYHLPEESCFFRIE